MQLDSSVWVAVISTIGGLGIAYISNVVAKQRASRHPKDASTIFDEYAALIKQQRIDNDRKQKQLLQTDALISQLQTRLDDMRELNGRQRLELAGCQRANAELSKQLTDLRAQLSGPSTPVAP